MNTPDSPRLTRVETPHLYAYTAGHGPFTLLFHGGMGSHTHWVRNLGPLSHHMTVCALDLPGLGDSPDVAEGTDANAYLDLVWASVSRLVEHGPTVDIIAFSFGSVVASQIATQLGEQLRRMTIIGPGGFGIPKGRNMDIRKRDKSSKNSDDEVAVIRHNLLQGMIYKPSAITDETIQTQLHNVNRTRFNSRVVSFEVSLPQNLKATHCPLQILWGEQDRYAFPSVQARVEQCEAARHFTKHILPDCGHWAQYECAGEVNELLIDFHARH